MKTLDQLQRAVRDYKHVLLESEDDNVVIAFETSQVFDARIVVSIEDGWEHVRIAGKEATPPVSFIGWVKDFVWGRDGRAVQFYSKRIPGAEFIVDLWRPAEGFGSDVPPLLGEE